MQAQCSAVVTCLAWRSGERKETRPGLVSRARQKTCPSSSQPLALAVGKLANCQKGDTGVSKPSEPYLRLWLETSLMLAKPFAK